MFALSVGGYYFGKIDDIKYILSQLLNLSLQDIGEVVTMDETPLSYSSNERFKSALIVVLLKNKRFKYHYSLLYSI